MLAQVVKSGSLDGERDPRPYIARSLRWQLIGYARRLRSLVKMATNREYQHMSLARVELAWSAPARRRAGLHRAGGAGGLALGDESEEILRFNCVGAIVPKSAELACGTPVESYRTPMELECTTDCIDWRGAVRHWYEVW